MSNPDEGNSVEPAASAKAVIAWHLQRLQS